LPQERVIPVGRYAVMTVTDTGCGISPDHLPHIFEPFYTTKSAGKALDWDWRRFMAS